MTDEPKTSETPELIAELRAGVSVHDNPNLSEAMGEELLRAWDALSCRLREAELQPTELRRIIREQTKRLEAAERRPSAEGWIPVSERLPEYGQEVLLHISGDPYIRKGKCIDRMRKAWSAPTDGYPVLGQCHPSHWRPLPPPPTVGGKGER